MPHSAVHPADRARLRAAAGARAWRLWRRAALLAAPIVALLTAAATVAVGDASRAAPLHRAAALSATPAATPTATPAPSPAFADATPSAAPAEGTTGTIELPPEPAIVPWLPGPTLPGPTLPGPVLLGPALRDATITPATPFSPLGGSAVDRGRAVACLAAAIYYEAASEPDDGQRAVAQVILNRVRHPAFPNTVCGVVYQGSEKASGCQFSFACDGAMARVPSRAGLARATRIAAAALGGYVFAPVGLATHYHTYAVTPAWNRTLVMTDAIGAHFFHRWKGYWGTALAFSQRYRGGEPVPGPHPRIAPPPPMPMLIPASISTAASRAAPPVTAPAAIQPAHADSGAAVDPSADSQILDRWKDSGRPIR